MSIWCSCALPFGTMASQLHINEKSSYERIGWDYSEMEIIDGGFSRYVPQIVSFAPTSGQIKINSSFITTVVTKNPEYDPAVSGSKKYLFENTYNRELDTSCVCNNCTTEEYEGMCYSVKFLDKQSEDEDEAQGIWFQSEGADVIAIVIVNAPLDSSKTWHLNSVETDLDELFEDETVTEVNLYTPIFEIIIDYIYRQPKLEAKWIDSSSLKIPVAGNESDEIGGIYVESDSSGLQLSSNGRLSINAGTVFSNMSYYLTGPGLTRNISNQLTLQYASRYTVGGIQLGVIDGACYITTDGSTPGP